MPYLKSLALKGFLEEIKLILQTTREASYKKAGIPNPALDMILQAAIFKTSAQLEEYLKNAITDWLFTAKRNNCLVGSLPAELRWFYITNAHVSAYKSFIIKSDESRLFNSLMANPMNSLFQNDNSIKDLIKPIVVIGDRKYPSTKNIKRLFNRLGIPNVFNEVDKRAKRSYEPIIRSFLDIRQAIAHQNPPNLTYNDVKHQLSNLKSFVSTLDRILFSHVSSVHGIECWRTI